MSKYIPRLDEVRGGQIYNVAYVAVMVKQGCVEFIHSSPSTGFRQIAINVKTSVEDLHRVIERQYDVQCVRPTPNYLWPEWDHDMSLRCIMEAINLINERYNTINNFCPESSLATSTKDPMAPNSHGYPRAYPPGSYQNPVRPEYMQTGTVSASSTSTCSTPQYAIEKKDEEQPVKCNLIKPPKLLKVNQDE